MRAVRAAVGLFLLGLILTSLSCSGGNSGGGGGGPNAYTITVNATAAVADPLYRTLFPSIAASARIRLTQLAYLMYRAKRDDAYCGGKTIAVLVPAGGDGPQWVTRESMEKAEDAVRTFDFLLKTAADAALPLPDESIESKGDWLAKSAKHSAEYLQKLQFHLSGGLIL